MKKIILAVTLLAFAGSQVQKAEARDRGWGIAAGVLGGLAVGTAIGASVSQPYYAPQPAYYAPPPTYYAPPPVYYQPAQPPVVYYQPAPACYYPRPVYYAPTVTFGFGFGRPYYYGHRYYRGRW